MNSPPIDWRSLILPAVLALAGVLLLAGVAWGGSIWLDQRASDYQRARSDLARMANRYRSASDDKAVYQEYASRFRQLQGSGMIGEERRLTWVEAVRAANRELELPVLRYDIAPRSSVPLEDAPFDPSRFALQRSEMTIRFGALHEGDVLRLLRALARDGAGLMETAACEMGWARGRGRGNGRREVRYEPGAANLDVGCSLRWYTLEIEPEAES